MREVDGRDARLLGRGEPAPGTVEERACRSISASVHLCTRMDTFERTGETADVSWSEKGNGGLIPIRPIDCAFDEQGQTKSLTELTRDTEESVQFLRVPP